MVLGPFKVHSPSGSADESRAAETGNLRISPKPMAEFFFVKMSFIFFTGHTLVIQWSQGCLWMSDLCMGSIPWGGWNPAFWQYSRLMVKLLPKRHGKLGPVKWMQTIFVHAPSCSIRI